MTCTTHHNACDCREAAHAKEVAALRAALAERQAAIDEWISADIQNAVEMERTPVDIELLTAANSRLKDAMSALCALATKEPQPAAKERTK